MTIAFKIDAHSPQAGEICQIIADITSRCWCCGGDSVACVVHGDKEGAEFLPVCERHKQWEFAKLGDGIYL